MRRLDDLGGNGAGIAAQIHLADPQIDRVIKTPQAPQVHFQSDQRSALGVEGDGHRFFGFALLLQILFEALGLLDIALQQFDSQILQLFFVFVFSFRGHFLGSEGLAGQTNAFFEHEHFRMLGTIGASEPFQLQLIGDDGSANAVLLKQKVK